VKTGSVASSKARILIAVCAAVATVGTFTSPAIAAPESTTRAVSTVAATTPQIIPKPVSLTIGDGQFTLTKKTKIVAPGSAASIGQVLRASLRPATGFPLPVTSGTAQPGDIAIAIADPGTLGDDTLGEGYQLDVSADQVSLRAITQHGLFNGVQTIKQLLPAWIASPTVQSGPWTMPVSNITDYPRYQYRGLMLDIARHYQTPEAVEELIDNAAAAKINTLHLHLSDDQGFRIVIDGFPRLTEIGAEGSVGTEGRTMDPGGFWTQEQFSEVVAYAAARFVTVVPEVDTPGHTNAIIMSEYNDTENPLLNDTPDDINCTVNNPPVWNYTGQVGYSALCPESDNTWTILTAIIQQLTALSSSQYYNIGGDEVPATVLSHEQYASLVNREGEIVSAQGKTVMGWAEIAGAGTELPPGSVAEYWNPASGSSSGTETGTEAVAKGMKIVMAPANHAYLDQKYAKNTPSSLGLTWACGQDGCDVDQFYNWDPSTYVTGVTDDNVIGVEGALWAETIRNLSEAEYMAFPRLFALAELGWSPKAERTSTDSAAYQDFLVRLAAQGARLTAGGVNFFPSTQVPWPLEAIGAHAANNGNRNGMVDGTLAIVSAPGIAADSITATIDWGDGTTSDGVVTGTAATGTSVNGLYSISGNHRYQDRDQYAPTVTITAPDEAPVTVAVQLRK
jgi:hexosaminidase